MSKLFRESAFNFGFGIGICLFVFLNYLVLLISYNEFIKPKQFNFSVGSYWAGFPVPFYQVVIAYPNSAYFSLIGLIINIVVALSGSFIIGLIFKFVWSKIGQKRLQ